MKVLLIVLLAGLAAKSSAESSADSSAGSSTDSSVESSADSSTETSAGSYTSSFLCSPVKVVDDFDIAEFPGHYYQYRFFSKLERYVSWIFGNCTQQTYTSVDGDKLLIKNYQIDSKGEVVPSDGFAVRDNPELRNGVIKVTVKQGLLSITIVYNILVFRPGKYTIVYSCILGIRSGWVLTREQEPSEETRRMIEEDIIIAHASGGPSLEEFKETPQSGCPDFNNL